MHIEIHSTGYNAEPLRHTHVIGKAGVGLYVSGLKRSTERYPDGKIRTPDVSVRIPSLRLYFPGGVSEYEYDNIRENWWVTFADPSPVYYDFALKRPVFRIGDHKIPIKAEIPLAPAEVSAMRIEFSEIRSGWLSGSPQGKAIAELILGGVLAKFLKSELSLVSPTIADRYKQLIDADVQWTHSLEQLSDLLSVRRDYARECFAAKFGISPGKYRTQQRLGRIMELITSSNLSTKEIAWSCGLKNVTYLNALTQKHFDTTPSELIRHFRLVTK